MSPPPINIDDSEITGATIDGQEVEEITVDGDVVFKSGIPIPDSAINRWKFDEGSGTTAFDSIRSNDLSINNASFESKSDAIGGSQLSFDSTDGSTDQLVGNSVSQIDRSNAFSIAVTVNPSSADDDYQVVHNGGGGDSNRFAINIESGVVGGSFADGTGGAEQSVTLDTRNRIVYTFDGNSTATMFVDKNGSNSGGFGCQSRGPSELYLGTRSDGIFPLLGTMDEPIFFNEELSQTQIDDDFNRQPYS
jgi:hypothetical protein